MARVSNVAIQEAAGFAGFITSSMFSSLEPLNQAKKAIFVYNRDNNSSTVSGLIGGVVFVAIGGVVPMVMGGALGFIFKAS
jgi:hypothetical protein